MGIVSLIGKWTKDPSGPYLIETKHEFYKFFLPYVWVKLYSRGEHHRIDLLESDFKSLLSLTREGDLFSTFKLIVLTGIEKLSREDKETLSRIIAGSGDKYDVLAITSAPFPVKGADYRKFDYLPSREELEKLIDFTVKLLGGEIEREATQYLAEYFQDQPHFLLKELEKLLSYREDGLITVEAVKNLVVPLKEENVFALIDAIRKKEIGEAFRVIDSFSESIKAVQLIRIIFAHFHRLLEVKTGLSLGVRGDHLARRTGVKPSYLARLITEAQKFSFEELEKIITEIDKTELQIKAQKIPPRFLLKKFVIDLVNSQDSLFT